MNNFGQNFPLYFDVSLIQDGLGCKHVFNIKKLFIYGNIYQTSLHNLLRFVHDAFKKQSKILNNPCSLKKFFIYIFNLQLLVASYCSNKTVNIKKMKASF